MREYCIFIYKFSILSTILKKQVYIRALFEGIQSLQENAKYCVMLVFETVIFNTKLLVFKNSCLCHTRRKVASLVLDIFLSKTKKAWVFLQTIYKKIQE